MSSDLPVFTLEQVKALGHIVVDGIVYAAACLCAAATVLFLTRLQIRHLAVRCVSSRRRERPRFGKRNRRVFAVPFVSQPLSPHQIRRQAPRWGAAGLLRPSSQAARRFRRLHSIRRPNVVNAPLLHRAVLRQSRVALTPRQVHALQQPVLQGLAPRLPPSRSHLRRRAHHANVHAVAQ